MEKDCLLPFSNCIGITCSFSTCTPITIMWTPRDHGAVPEARPTRPGSGVERPRIVDVAIVARAHIDGVEKRLQCESDVRIGQSQGYGGRRQRTHIMGGPGETARSFLPTANEHIVGTIRPFVGHRHSPATPQQIDLDEVGSPFRICLTLACVLQPACRSEPLIRGGQDLNACDQLAFGLEFANLKKALTVFRFHERAYSDGRRLALPGSRTAEVVATAAELPGPTP